MADVDDRLQLELFERVRPVRLVGGETYRLWLGLAEPSVFGLRDALSDEQKLARLGDVEPCARTEEELASFQSAFENFLASVDVEDVDLTAPTLCR